MSEQSGMSEQGMSAQQAQTAPAGWYEDPGAPEQHRYWDGTAWTEITRRLSDAGAQPDDRAASQPAQPAQPAHPAQPARPAPPAKPGGGFFHGLFDFSFSDFVSLKFAKIIYLIGIILSLLAWLGGALLGFVFASVAAPAVSYYYGSGGGVFLAPTLWLLFGWIPALVGIVLLRVLLEFVVASVRTAQNTSKLVEATTPQQ